MTSPISQVGQIKGSDPVMWTGQDLPNLIGTALAVGQLRGRHSQSARKRD